MRNGSDCIVGLAKKATILRNTDLQICIRKTGITFRYLIEIYSNGSVAGSECAHHLRIINLSYHWFNLSTSGRHSFDILAFDLMFIQAISFERFFYSQNFILFLVRRAFLGRLGCWQTPPHRDDDSNFRRRLFVVHFVVSVVRWQTEWIGVDLRWAIFDGQANRVDCFGWPMDRPLGIAVSRSQVDLELEFLQFAIVVPKWCRVRCPICLVNLRLSSLHSSPIRIVVRLIAIATGILIVTVIVFAAAAAVASRASLMWHQHYRFVQSTLTFGCCMPANRRDCPMVVVRMRMKAHEPHSHRSMCWHRRNLTLADHTTWASYWIAPYFGQFQSQTDLFRAACWAHRKCFAIVVFELNGRCQDSDRDCIPMDISVESIANLGECSDSNYCWMVVLALMAGFRDHGAGAESHLLAVANRCPAAAVVRQMRLDAAPNGQSIRWDQQELVAGMQLVDVADANAMKAIVSNCR